MSKEELIEILELCTYSRKGACTVCKNRDSNRKCTIVCVDILEEAIRHLKGEE